MNTPPNDRDSNSDTDKDVLALDDFRTKLPIPVDEQAIAWLVKLGDRQSIKSTDNRHELRRAFLDWFNHDAAHREAFEAASLIWSASGQAVANPIFEPQPRYQPTAISLLSVAAMAIFTWFVLLASPQIYTTAPGEQQRILLADGSTAFLNTDSEIQVQMYPDRRVVELVQGEVWFDVVSNSQRPFSVTSGNTVARALGTAYAVRKLDSVNSSVTVTEGSVAVVGKEFGNFTVTAGEQFTPATNESVQARVISVDVQSEMAWQRGQLVYEDRPLLDVLTDMNRYVTRNMVLSDEEIGQTHVSAVIQIADQAAMVDALAQVMDLRWKAVTDELIIITPRAIP